MRRTRRYKDIERLSFKRFFAVLLVAAMLVGCSKEAKLRCPNCKKLGIKSESYFCGKECFNSCWAEHKKIHEEYLPIEDDFEYTGPLRPYKITPRREIPKSIQCPDYAFHPEGVSESEEKA